MFNAWERFPDTPYELPNGTTIRVDEWRKELKTGTAIIRSGYLRIDNCPRFQVVVLFNNQRIMTDRPMMRSFNDALEAADEWLTKYAKNPPRRLVALPSPEDVPVVEKPKTYRVTAKPRPQPFVYTSRQRRHHSKLGEMDSAKLDEITVREYNKLDLARTSLEAMHATISILMPQPITMAMVQQRLRKNNISYKADKKKALERAKPIVKEALRQVLVAYPDYGAGKCYTQLNKTEHRGYRFKLVNEMYLELRKELNSLAAHGHRQNE